MTRLDPVDSDTLYPKVTSRYREHAFALRPDGALPTLYGVLGNAPAMLSNWLDFAWTLRLDTSMPRALRELAILLVGHRLSAPYCIAAHDVMAAEAGVSEDQLRAIATWATSALFDEDQRAVLTLAEAMLDYSVTAETVDRVCERFGAEQTVELVLTVAFYQMVASTTKALDLQPD